MRHELVEQRVATLAARQGGVVARAQLLEIGLGPSAIARRVRAGRLHPVFRGVYAVGHPAVPRGGRLRAAVLASGRGAVLSHDSAAEWWGLQERRSAAIEVTVPIVGGAGVTGTKVHRTAYLPPHHITCRRGIPITTAQRTILDRAARRTRRGVERDIDEAYRRRLVDRERLMAMLGEAKGRAGTATLRAVLSAHATGSTWTRNDFEEAFLALTDAADLPRPIANHPVGPYVLDFHWPDRGLAVECDGAATHLTPRAFEDDRARDADLWVTHGVHVLRFTYMQVTRGQAVTVHRLRGALKGTSP